MKRVLVLVLMVFAVFGLASCGEKDTLRTVSMFGGEDPNAAVYESLIKEFKEETGWKVKDRSESSSEEWKASVIADFKAGREPDVIQYFTGETAKPFTSTDKVVSIVDIRKEYPNFAKNITPSVLDTYAVPTTGFVEGLFVNTTFFTTTELQNYLNKASWTWTEFKALLAALAAEHADLAGFKPVAFSVDEPHYWIEHMLLATHGENFAYNMPKASDVTQTHTWVKALAKLNELKPYLSLEADASMMKSRFHEEGLAAIYLDGSWYAGNIAATTTGTHAPKPTNVKVFPFPSIPTSEGGTGKVYLQSGYTSGFYITKKAWDDLEKREKAVRFIEIMTSTAALTKYAQVAGIPADDSVVLADQTNLSKEMFALPSKTEANALPLSDAGKAGSFAQLVSKAQSYVDADLAIIVDAVKAYLNAQD